MMTHDGGAEAALKERRELRTEKVELRLEKRELSGGKGGT
jgi:hypothetical protein